jgi:SPP1 family predicted phage head-tail adaptor
MSQYRIGQLDQKATIYKKTRSQNGSGGFNYERSDIATVWTYVRQLSAREVQQAQKLTASALCVFVIRNRDDIFESYYIEHKGFHYNIRSIPPRNPRDLFMEIRAERGVA